MYLVASVRPSVRLSVRPSVRPSVRLFICLFVCRGSALPSAAKSEEELLPVQSVCLCACNQWAYADNCADAVDRLLICKQLEISPEAT